MSFADNSSTNSTELFDELQVHSGGNFSVIVFLLTSFSVFLFPFYVYIINRPQDSQRAVFPFLNFFFIVICFSIVGYAFATLYYAVIFVKGRRIMQDFMGTHLLQSRRLLFDFFAVMTFLNMSVCQLLTSILAFHRFLLYFLPTFGDFLTPGKKTTIVLICLLYSFVIVGFAIFSCISRNVWAKHELLPYFYYVGLGLSELLISIPYTFMILSIRRLTQLASGIQSRPEKYIAYQIVIAFFFKLISLLGVFFISNSKEENLKSSILVFMITDMFTFPLAVQLAYILSNKKNVDTLIKLITGKVMFWKNRTRVEVETSTRF